MVRFQWALSPGSWLSLAADAITYRYVDSGGLAGSSWSAGPPTVGLSPNRGGHDRDRDGRLRSRCSCPSIRRGRRAGSKPASSSAPAFARRLGARFAVDGGLAFAAPIDLVAGADPRPPGAGRPGRGVVFGPSRGCLRRRRRTRRPSSRPTRRFSRWRPGSRAGWRSAVASGSPSWSSCHWSGPIEQTWWAACSSGTVPSPCDPIQPSWLRTPGSLASGKRIDILRASAMPKIKMKSNSSAKKRF